MRGKLRALIATGVVTGCALTPADLAPRGDVPADQQSGAAAGLDLVPVLEIHGGPAPPRAIAETAPQGGMAGEEPPLPGRGHIAVRVKWPDRSAQLIPNGTSRVSFSAQAAGFTYSTDLTAGNMRSVLKNVPAGPATLSASAFDAMGSVLASTSAQITVLSGAVISARLVLSSGQKPTVTDLVPQAGGAGAQVRLVGTGFGSDSPVKETLKIYVGGLPVAGTIFRTSPSEAYFSVPAWATRSVVTIDVVSGASTQSAASPKDLFRLKALVPATTSITLKVGSTASVAITGVDVLDGTWSVPVEWSAATGADDGTHVHTGDPSGHGGSKPIQISGFNGWISVTEAGEYHVMAKNGDLLATASVIAIP